MNLIWNFNFRFDNYIEIILKSLYKNFIDIFQIEEFWDTMFWNKSSCIIPINGYKVEKRWTNNKFKVTLDILAVKWRKKFKNCKNLKKPGLEKTRVFLKKPSGYGFFRVFSGFIGFYRVFSGFFKNPTRIYPTVNHFFV